jgi:hypothetical protein
MIIIPQIIDKSTAPTICFVDHPKINKILCLCPSFFSYHFAVHSLMLMVLHEQDMMMVVDLLLLLIVVQQV